MKATLDGSSSTDGPTSKSPETEIFVDRLSQVGLRYRSGTEKKVDARKNKKSGKKSGGSSVSRENIYLPPMPLKEPISVVLFLFEIPWRISNNSILFANPTTKFEFGPKCKGDDSRHSAEWNVVDNSTSTDGRLIFRLSVVFIPSRVLLISVHQGGVYCYASGGGRINASLVFKEMVKDFHLAGIKVIMDVVYNRTNEVDDKYPYTTSFFGITRYITCWMGVTIELLRCLTYNNYTESAPCIGMTNTGPTVFHQKCV
ncbi:unnamed protein product [Lactuca saligna]|uniref:Alpha-amylase n=1 Tax=Lactuca saligna TaxID=75948 RepID=A0AA36E1K0_LACSI|nr:unnamed protein product [Lactuca saligna]